MLKLESLCYHDATMLTPTEFTHLLTDIESDRVERTVSVSDTDKFAKAVCAFANDLPAHGTTGYLFVGIDDSGRPTGMKVTDQLLQNLGALRSGGNIQPLPTLSVYKMTHAEGEVAVVEVTPSDLPPVRYKGQVWIRVGPTRAVASEQEERILTERRVARAHTFDSGPLMDAGLDDLAQALFHSYRKEVVAEEVIAANNRSLAEQMASLRFFDGKNNRPTVAGVLLFGKNPRHFFPGDYVQYLRLPGASLTELPEDQAEISGDLHAILRELDLRLKALVRSRIKAVSGLREKLVTDYPTVAVRELLMNAVLHRDYRSNTPIRFYWFADRIEIQSPGGLYGEVTKETLTRRNSYRNPVLAEAMKALGYVNRFGYGIQRAQEALQSAGHPPATFDIDDRMFLAVIYGKT